MAWTKGILFELLNTIHEARGKGAEFDLEKTMSLFWTLQGMVMFAQIIQRKRRAEGRF